MCIDILVNSTLSYMLECTHAPAVLVSTLYSLVLPGLRSTHLVFTLHSSSFTWFESCPCPAHDSAHPRDGRRNTFILKFLDLIWCTVLQSSPEGWGFFLSLIYASLMIAQILSSLKRKAKINAVGDVDTPLILIDMLKPLLLVWSQLSLPVNSLGGW